MFVNRIFLQFIAMIGLVSSSTTTVDSSCTINYDFTSSIAEMLQRYLEDTHQGLQAQLSILKNQMNNSVIELPTPGTFSNQWAGAIYNASTGVVAWGLMHEVDFEQFSCSGGFNLLYGVSIITAGKGLETYTGIAPELTGAALAACTTYSCTTTMNYYTPNQNGKPSPLIPYKTATYNTPTRPWFWPNIVNPTMTTYNLYYTSLAQTNLFSMTMPYATVVHSATFTEYKVAASMIVVEYLSDAIAELNKDGVGTVGYIMTTVYPVGLLLATSVGIKTNMTTYAVKSSNVIISSTAQYIISNNIKTATAGYVDSLGCYLDVQFVTYGASDPTLITAPASANLPAASTTDVFPTTGIEWTVVSCNVQAAPTTTYSTTDDATTMGGSSKAVTALVAIIFVIALLFAFAAIYYMCFMKSSAAAPSHATAATPASTEMTASPMTDSKA